MLFGVTKLTTEAFALFGAGMPRCSEHRVGGGSLPIAHNLRRWPVQSGTGWPEVRFLPKFYERLPFKTDLMLLICLLCSQFSSRVFFFSVFITFGCLNKLFYPVVAFLCGARRQPCLQNEKGYEYGIKSHKVFLKQISSTAAFDSTMVLLFVNLSRMSWNKSLFVLERETSRSEIPLYTLLSAKC